MDEQNKNLEQVSIKRKNNIIIIITIIILVIIVGGIYLFKSVSQKDFSFKLTTQIIKCTTRGGEWKMLPDSSGDRCGPLDGLWATAPEEGCYCGVDKCWDGKKCVKGQGTSFNPN